MPFKELKEDLLPWKKEFLKNIKTFEALGVSKEKAIEYLKTYLEKSSTAAPPKTLNVLTDIQLLNDLGTYTEFDPEIRKFMIAFLTPLLSNFTVKGLSYIEKLVPLLGKVPVTIVSNHLSHFDAAAIFILLYNSGELGRKLAESTVFIAGRPVFEVGFTRMGIGMFNSLLVCSRKDIVDNIGAGDIMNRVNMRTFRHSVKLQGEGHSIAIFPEGTRSRTGQLLSFVDAVYHYIANKLVVPFTLEGTDKLLPANSFLFQQTAGHLTIGQPIFMGKPTPEQLESLPEEFNQISIPKGVNKKLYSLDTLAAVIGSELHIHRHGAYRNLYKNDIALTTKEVLIRKPAGTLDMVVVIGHSRFATAAACILANKEYSIQIFILDEDNAASFNAVRRDLENYPLYTLPPNISFTSDIEEIKKGTLFVQGVQPWELEKYYSKISDTLNETDGLIVNIMKGLTGSSKGLILSDLSEIYGIDSERLSVIAGSNYPDQIMERKITGFEVASVNPEKAPEIANLFNVGYIFTRLAPNTSDVIGVQLAGGLKLIYSMGIGMLDGYYEKNLGGNNDSTLFHIMNRIFEELVKVGINMGGKKDTFYGLSGLNDLFLTCFGVDTRDRQYGFDLAFHKENIYKKSSGIFNLNALQKLIQIEATQYPILYVINQVINKKTEIEQALSTLLLVLRKKILPKN